MTNRRSAVSDQQAVASGRCKPAGGTHCARNLRIIQLSKSVLSRTFASEQRARCIPARRSTYQIRRAFQGLKMATPLVVDSLCVARSSKLLVAKKSCVPFDSPLIRPRQAVLAARLPLLDQFLEATFRRLVLFNCTDVIMQQQRKNRCCCHNLENAKERESKSGNDQLHSKGDCKSDGCTTKRIPSFP